MTAEELFLPPSRRTRPGRRECSCRRGWFGPESAPSPCPICRPETYARLNKRRGSCTVCGMPLDPVITAEGFTTHPLCDPLERSMFDA